MTYIQPSKNHGTINKILMALVVCLVLATFWLVSLYNNSVNLSHGLKEMKLELQTVEAANAGFKEKIFTLVDPTSFESLATLKNLVQDKKPHYLELVQR